MKSDLLEFSQNPYDETEQQSSHERHDVRNTIYKEQIIKILYDGHYRYRTVKAIEAHVHNWMSQNFFLSNQSPKTKALGNMTHFNQLEYTKLCHEESQLLLNVAIHPIDRRRSELYVLLDEIFKHTDNMTMTRTVGEDRVGVTNGVIVVKNVNEVKQEEIVKTEREEERKNKTGGIY